MRMGLRKAQHPVYYGYLTQGHKEMLQRILKTANRRGFTVREYDLEALADNAQYDLFHNSVVLQTTV